ncbi:MAG: hypothetical protein V3W41_07385 [Planctomycetota bacterium]
MRNLSYLMMCLFAFSTTGTAQQLPEVFRHVLTATAGIVDGSEIGDIDGDGRDDVAFFHRNFFASSLPPFVRHSSTGATFDVQRFFGAPLPAGLYNATRFYRLADLDGDGADDFAAYFVASSLFNSAGALQIRSGLTNAVLADYDLPFGAEFTVTPDRNGDGIPELLLAHSDGNLPNPFTRVELVDGATLTRSVLYNDPQPLPLSALVTVADVDNDGIEDFVLGSGFFFFPGGPGGTEGIVRVVSGAAGTVLSSWIGSALESFGADIEKLSDIDGDGVNEVLVFSLGFVPGSGFIQIGRVQAFSTATGTQLFAIVPSANGDEIIRGIRSSGDVNGDGFRDFLVTIELTAVAATGIRVELRSGMDGSVLTLANREDDFVGDLNGDGIADFVAVVSPPVPGTITTVGRTFMGGESYGPSTGSRTLEWIPLPNLASVGHLTFSGAMPNAPLLGAISLRPANTTIGGTTFPLLISPAPADLILTVNLTADAAGSHDDLISLLQPSLSGVVLYFQFAELGANPGTSNAVELLFNGF